MSNVNNFTAFYGSAMKPKRNVEEKRLAKIRDHQKRERKEKLYSYPSSVKRRNTLP